MGAPDWIVSAGPGLIPAVTSGQPPSALAAFVRNLAFRLSTALHTALCLPDRVPLGDGAPRLLHCPLSVSFHAACGTGRRGTTLTCKRKPRGSLRIFGPLSKIAERMTAAPITLSPWARIGIALLLSRRFWRSTQLVPDL